MSTPEIETALNEIENKNYAAAFRLLSLLAESGSPEAICNLATLYQCGLGVEMDGKRAVALYEKVASLDIQEGHLSGIALNNLATIYTTGLPDVEQNLQKAGEYMERAKKLGFGF